MMKQEDGGGNGWGKVCDTCRSAPSTVYCRADSAFLCTGCDSRIHAANKMASRHERVWVCEACERAPAAFLCKADAASLCANCDSDIHSANPLARRHHRVPIMPIPATLYGPQGNDSGGSMIGVHNLNEEADDGFLTQDVDETIDEDDEDEAASWLLFNPVKNSNNNNSSNQSNGMMFGGGEVVDEYLDLVDYNSCQDNQYNCNGNNDDHHQYQSAQQQFLVPQKSYGCDGEVPDRSGFIGKDHQLHLQQQQQHHPSFQLGLDYESSNTGYGYPASMSHSVSMSSMDCGIVPDTTMSDASVSHHRTSKGTIDLFASTAMQLPQQLPPMDREARVLRYREKKKNRKFEKTIRYASRKAYAETRPRIKGRFAKRTDVESEVDQMLSTELMMESGYGIVPSF
ncbi:OLC1v1009887C1 [Oldenlandia corymbosa var. corymbosa]|uniref:OLC1v1009887C1 n=1 Tax=Oldenlandia corymbosa var. corymbosa TaxID=529605 RepID=A0AAV1DQ72_OLDCO|nr:OLC1v1009887C1 [Oldenlandia corymbosa var. corymbosa]